MSFASEILEKIEKILLGKADNDIAEYEIAGRSLKKYSFSELIKLRDKFKREVEAEKKAQALANGIKNKNKIFVRF